jgi:predicted unusual protein kinase regulating ubiquinone biosynthesis (AarF/ABC1/UbiB family)
VKVRRPGVVAQVHEDLDILRNLADRADRRWDAIRQYGAAWANSCANRSALRASCR